MRIDIITVLPEMLEGFFNCSIMSRAQKKGIAEIHIHNLRDYAYDRYRKVDDYPFGGFAGMVMKYRWMSFSGSSASRNSSCATTMLAEASFTSSPDMMILSFNSLE